jgi:glycosyltransferase involved in cell wall biosynthesis
MEQIDVSVIVTTRNEEKNIENCLRSIKEQTHPPERIEIIVVDNDSTDGTKEIASQFTRMVYNSGPERSAQRNFGIARAKGKHILYLDADMILSRELIAECARLCETRGCGALYIPEKIIGEGFWIRVRDFERSFYNGTCIDAVRFVRRETALAVGGFDEGLNGPEDWDFDRRVGAITPTGITATPLRHNEETFRLREYLSKKRYYSKGFERYRQKWGMHDKIVGRQLGFLYRYIVVFTENGKWRRLLRHPVLVLGMFMLRGAVGFAYLCTRLSPVATGKVGSGGVRQ